MSKYKCFVPFIPDMGSVQPLIVSPTPMESMREQALWYINSMRDHDGLRHLTRLPNGTRFERIEEA